MENTKKFGIIGNPVGHSKSPFIHSSFASLNGDDIKYDLCEVKEGELEKFLRRAVRDGYEGFNVTVPYKEEIIKYLEEISDDAKKIGAVNAIKLTENGFIGINTDLDGFMKASEEFKLPVKGADTVVIGAGGAARAVGAALLCLGAFSVTFINRTYEKAERLSYDLNEAYTTEKFKALPLAKLSLIPENIVCIQTTSLGLAGENALITDDNFYKKIKAAMDIVPMPRTDFIKRVEANGIKCENGYRMLLNQAVGSYEFFNDCTLSEDIVNKVRLALVKRKNLILIGFMGAGKSVVGRVLAEDLKLEFFDLDDFISETTKLSISEIFEKYGEDWFRDQEHLAIKCVTDSDTRVIATGGGIVKRPKNLEILKEGGTIIYLKGSTEMLWNRVGNDCKRPLSKSLSEFTRLYSERLPLYEEVADITINVDNKTPNEILNEIKSLLSMD